MVNETFDFKVQYYSEYEIDHEEIRLVIFGIMKKIRLSLIFAMYWLKIKLINFLLKVVKLNPSTGIELDRIGSCNFWANESVIKLALEHVSNRVWKPIGFCFRSNTCTTALANSFIFGIEKSDLKSVSLTDNASSQSFKSVSVNRGSSDCDDNNDFIYFFTMPIFLDTFKPALNFSQRYKGCDSRLQTVQFWFSLFVIIFLRYIKLSLSLSLFLSLIR